MFKELQVWQIDDYVPPRVMNLIVLIQSFQQPIISFLAHGRDLPILQLFVTISMY